MISPNSSSSNAMLQEAIACHQAGRYDEAAQRYHDILRIEPLHTDANHNLGILKGQMGQPAAGLPFLKTALETAPSQGHYVLSYTNALLAVNQADLACHILQAALGRGLQSAEIYNNLGNALRQLGQHDASISNFQLALQANPRYALALYNLGSLLQEMGKREDAITCYQQALAIHPDFTQAYNNLGLVLRSLGRTNEAVSSFSKALQLNPYYFDVYNSLGNALRELGRFDQAVAVFNHVIQLKPDDVEAYNNLGNTLHSIERFDAAAASYRQALAINPALAEIYNNLGNTLRSLNRFDEAIVNFRRAIVIQPEFAQAHNNLALVLKYKNHHEAEISCEHALVLKPNLVEAIVFMAELVADKGQFSRAEVLLQRAIAIEPDLPEAWAAIAKLRKMRESDTIWLDNVKRIISTNLSPRKEVFLRYALGKYFDDTQDFEQAFANYQQANELSKQYIPPYDRQKQTRYVDHLSAQDDNTQANREHANPSTRPVFIVGMPRSGTTLAEQIIAAHPNGFGAGELSYWIEATAKIDSQTLSDTASNNLLPQLATGYLQLLDTISPDAHRIVDKMPANFQCLGLIHAALPNARIIHMERHPVDTCLSIYFQHFESYHSYANDLDDLAHYYLEYQRAMKHWQRVLPPESILRVPYEQLVTDPESWSRKMLEFIGLPWDTRCLDFHRNENNVSTTSKWQVRQKISSSSVARWRHYEKFVGMLLNKLSIQ